MKKWLYEWRYGLESWWEMNLFERESSICDEESDWDVYKEFIVKVVI